jgi:hypothetical protein
MFLLHTGYKRANGWVSDREPEYLYATGLTLLAFLSPLLEPEDAVDPRVADLIKRGHEFDLNNFYLRNSQRFSPGRLIDRLSKLEPEPLKAESLAKRTASNALWRNPVGILQLGLHTYTDLWNVGTLKKSAELDFSFRNLPDDNLLSLLASHFHLAQRKGATNKSFLQWYYVAAWPYYFLILLAPLLSALAIATRPQRPAAILLFIHISLMLTVSMIFGGESIRFLQPVSFMTLCVIALGTQALLARRSRSGNDTLTESTADECALQFNSAIGQERSGET